MIAIQKFDPKNFDRSRVWEDRYRQMYAAQHDFSEYEKQVFWPLLKKKLNKEGKYLDAGCGIGGWILFLNEHGFQVDGIDSNRGAVRALSEYDPDVSVKIASTNAIPYTDETFDGIISIGSLEYAEGHIQESFAEMYRTLKKGGFVCVEVPLKNTLRTILYVPLKRLEGIVMRMLGRNATFAYYLFSRTELEDMLMKTGFAIETVLAHDLPDADSHFGLYSNWPLLRGTKPYELNIFGRIVKAVSNTISPWVASAGVVIIAKK